MDREFVLSIKYVDVRERTRIDWELWKNVQGRFAVELRHVRIATPKVKLHKTTRMERSVKVGPCTERIVVPKERNERARLHTRHGRQEWFWRVTTG